MRGLDPELELDPSHTFEGSLGERALGGEQVPDHPQGSEQHGGVEQHAVGAVSHDPRALPSMLVAAITHEVVIGSRYIKGGVIPKWSLSRKLLSRGGNEYATLMLGLKVADSTSGFRVYSKSALEKIHYQSVTADGYGFQIEMTHRARRGGASIVEVPISFTDRTHGDSKMSKNIVIEALWLVTKWAIERPFANKKSLDTVDQN